jgi:hypothetical protein
MKATVTPQLHNLMQLRDTIPFMRQMEEEGEVNYNTYMNECGTPSCWRGYCVVLLGISLHRDRPFGELPTIDSEFFGLLPGEWSYLFGAGSAGTIDDRARFLDQVIERHMKQTGESPRLVNQEERL